MKVFTCTDHDSHWPVGVASVVVAPSEDVAYALLEKELEAHHLDGRKPFTLQEINLTKPAAYVLQDGNY